jgi:hypothetical protein
MKMGNGAWPILLGVALLAAGLLAFMYGDFYASDATWTYFVGAGGVMMFIGILVWGITDYMLTESA